MKLVTSWFFLSAALSSAMFAQIAAPAAQTASNPLLMQLDQVTRQTVMDLGRVRTDKWKADSNTKNQARGNIDSLQKNLTAALPGLMQQVQSSPTSVGAAVKLYRNINVVYDVLANVTESTGAFGSKDDYQALAIDISNMESVRKDIADQVERMAVSQDTAYSQAMNQLRTQQQTAASSTAPAKKVIVDENEPAKKTSSKKKKAAPSSSTAPPNGSPK